jgi:hypothetical protein
VVRWLCAAFHASTLLTDGEANELIDWMVAPNKHSIAFNSNRRERHAKDMHFPSADSEWESVWRMSRDGTDLQALLAALKGRGASFIVCTTANGSLFGGFTPVTRPFPASGTCLTDRSGGSFLFSLRNPHGHPPRPFRIASPSTIAVVAANDALNWGSGNSNRGRDLCKSASRTLGLC